MNELDNVLEMWKKDAIVDRTEPGRELINIPILHSKYLDILAKNRRMAKDAEFQLNKTKKLKWEYYTGKLDEKVLKQNGWEPFPYVLKSDIQTYIDSDDDIRKCLVRKQMYDDIVDVCTAILKELNSRTFQLRDFIAWERFIQGS